MNTIRIGGVNEHFNMPWKLLLESKALKESGIQAQWMDYAGGTGAMVEDLNKDALDIAILLTEGAVMALHENHKFRILSFFVNSPLVWGIHVAAHSPYQSINDIKDHRYAISRFGSGSHIMTYIHAKNQNWPYDHLKFVPVQSLEGARQALAEQSADIFFWEKFTTQPYVDNGEFRRIGEVPTPFNCFVVAVSEKLMRSRNDEVTQLMELLFAGIKEFEQQSNQATTISTLYHLQENYINEWLSSTQWATTYEQNFEHLTLAKNILKDLGLIQSELSAEGMVWSL